jgi:hypothetical protein
VILDGFTRLRTARQHNQRHTISGGRVSHAGPVKSPSTTFFNYFQLVIPFGNFSHRDSQECMFS